MRVDLNATGIASRVIYSNGIDEPIGVRGRFNDLSTGQITAAAAAPEKVRFGGAVVLLPRHFLFNPLVPLRVLAGLRQDEHDSITLSLFEVDALGTTECLVFDAPSLIRAIRHHFALSTYWDLLTEAEGAQRAAFAADIDNKIHLPDDDFTAPYIAAPVDDEGEFDLLGDVAFDLPQPSLIIGNPAKGEDGLLDLFRNCDADFILRGVSADKRRALRRMTREWCSAVHRILAAEFFTTSGKLIRRRVAKFSPNATRIDEHSLEECFSTACQTFAARPRITRRALENAGRLVSAGFEPRALVVMPTKTIIRESGRLLRTTLVREVARDHKQAARKAPLNPAMTSGDEIQANFDIMEHLALLRNGFPDAAERYHFWKEASELASQYEYNTWEDSVYSHLPERAHQLRELVLTYVRSVRQLRSKRVDNPKLSAAIEALKPRIEAQSKLLRCTASNLLGPACGVGEVSDLGALPAEPISSRTGAAASGAPRSCAV